VILLVAANPSSSTSESSANLTSSPLGRSRSHAAALLCFKTTSDFASYNAFPLLTGYMATEPWQRAGYPPLTMIEELQKASAKAH
jgi:hypothetical protein